MMADLGSETITFTAEAATDMYGDPIPGTALSGAVEGCAVYPVSSSESNDRSTLVTDKYAALVPLPLKGNLAGKEITDDFKATWRGLTFVIDGRPALWTYLEGDDAGLQINLRRSP